MTPFFLLWQVSGAEDQPPAVDGSGLITTRRRRKPVKPKDRTPEDIRREQLEDERYLESLNKPQQVPAKATSGYAGEKAKATPPVDTNPVADPTLADVAARAASAVQAKLEEADSAAALGLLAEQQQRRRTLVLLLALD